MITICSHINCTYYYQYNPPRGNYYCSCLGDRTHVAIGSAIRELDFVLENIQTNGVQTSEWYGITIKDVIKACPHMKQLTLIAKLKQI